MCVYICIQLLYILYIIIHICIYSIQIFVYIHMTIQLSTLGDLAQCNQQICGPDFAQAVKVEIQHDFADTAHLDIRLIGQ